MSEKEMMTTREVAEYFGVELGTVQMWRHRKRGPKFILISPNCALYRRQDVLKWEKTNGH